MNAWLVCRVASDGGKLLIPNLAPLGLPQSHASDEALLTLIREGGLGEQEAGLGVGGSKHQLCQTTAVSP